MKRKILKSAWIMILIAIMLLPPLRAAFAAGFNYYTSIYIDKYPDKLDYYVGESFDKTGMRIYGNRVKADGSTDVCDLGLDGLIVSPSVFNKVGNNQKVTLRLDCMAASGKKEPFYVYLYVNVEEMEGDPPMYWTKEIKAEAKKTVYLVGDSFDKSGLKVWAYSEGDVPPGEEKWDCTNYVKSISPTTFTKAGEQYVTVTAHLTTEHSSADFKAKIKVKVYSPIEIKKHPGDEIVEEGSSCGFTVKADHASSFAWYFVKGKSRVSAKEASSFFPGLHVSGADSKHLKLSDIPLSLDDWEVLCEFSNKAQTVESNTASITVYEKEAEATTPKPTSVPTAESSAEPSAETTVEPSAEPSAEPKAETTAEPSSPPALTVETPSEAPASKHTHSFDGVYHSDGKQHWLECACGERTAAADHVVTEWKILAKATKNENGVRRGYCAICGAEVLEDIPYEEGDSSSLLLIIGLGLAGVALVTLVTALAIVAAKNKRYGKRAS